MKQNKKKTNKLWQRNALIALCAVLAVVFVVLLFGTVYVHSLLGTMQRVDPDDETMMHPSDAILETDPELETIPPDSTETIPHIESVVIDNAGITPVQHGSHITNILLVGQDARPGEKRQRSDSMILITVNTAKNTLTMTSFMRDQYVEIPGYLPNKLNAAYAFGGFKLLNRTLEKNFGIKIDGNIEVDFASFQTLIDELGGVEIDLTQAEVDWLRETCGHNLQAGKNILNGAQALDYSRIRKLDSDYKRTERQRKVLTSLMDSYKNKPVTELMDVVQTMLPLITTDMSNGEILSLAGKFLPMLTSLQVNSLRIPVDGSFSTGTLQVREGLKGWFEYNVDFRLNHKLLTHLYEK